MMKLAVLAMDSKMAVSIDDSFSSQGWTLDLFSLNYTVDLESFFT